MKASEKGYALIAVLALILFASTVFLANQLPRTPEKLTQRLRREEGQTALEALETAKARLIALAISQATTPGAFPCPDYINNGKDNSTCASYAIQPPGRYPYVKSPTSAQSQLNMTPPPRQKTRSGREECLWYAISPSYGAWINNQNRTVNPPAGKPGQGQLNLSNAGDLRYNDDAVIAVLIAPGDAVEAQVRQPSVSPSWCTQGSVEHYLEALYRAAQGQRNNADSQGLFMDARGLSFRHRQTGFCEPQVELDPDVAGTTECHNDTILAITRSELMKPLIREVLKRLVADETKDAYGGTLIPSARPGLMSLLAGEASATLEAIRKAHPGKGMDPNAFDAALFGQANLQKLSGAMDCTKSIGVGSAYDPRPLWLCANGWYRFIEYDADQQSLSIQFDEGLPKAYVCRVFLPDNKVRCL